MESKFTPGPWSLDNESYIRPDCLKGKSPLNGVGSGQDCWPAICDVAPWPQDRWDCLGPEESRANARLIAAAPELYAFAEYIFRLPDLVGDAKPFPELREKARIALALANGQDTGKQ